MTEKKHDHYFKNVSHLETVDVYRVLDIFSVTDPCLQHAIKKLLVAGGRGAKSRPQDVQEAIDTLARWLQMREEDSVGKPLAQSISVRGVTWPVEED